MRVELLQRYHCHLKRQLRVFWPFGGPMSRETGKAMTQCIDHHRCRLQPMQEEEYGKRRTNEASPQQATGYQKEVDSERSEVTKQASGNRTLRD
jgi:hypothetical protein